MAASSVFVVDSPQIFTETLIVLLIVKYRTWLIASAKDPSSQPSPQGERESHNIRHEEF